MNIWKHAFDEPPDLSEQLVLQCTYEDNYNACNGGSAKLAMNLIKESGLP